MHIFQKTRLYNFYPNIACWGHCYGYYCQEKHALHYKLNTEIATSFTLNISCARCNDQLPEDDYKPHFEYC